LSAELSSLAQMIFSPKQEIGVAGFMLQQGRETNICPPVYKFNQLVTALYKLSSLGIMNLHDVSLPLQPTFQGLTKFFKTGVNSNHLSFTTNVYKQHLTLLTNQNPVLKIFV
jgi:hypothetical protein